MKMITLFAHAEAIGKRKLMKKHKLLDTLTTI